jgi:DHA2 family multidrug resistance protein
VRFAQSLPQIVGFRLLQGLFGAALVPLSQGILLDIYTRRGARLGDGAVRRLGHGRAGARPGHRRLADREHQLALGVLHQRADRRAGLCRHAIFVKETKTDLKAKLDWFGFGMLSLAIASLQLFLDRGEQLDWFSSGEIMIEAHRLRAAFYIFLVHTFTAKNPSSIRAVPRPEFRVGMIFIFVVGITYLASLALMTPYLQTLMGYPVVTAGIVMGPRGSAPWSACSSSAG